MRLLQTHTNFQAKYRNHCLCVLITGLNGFVGVYVLLGVLQVVFEPQTHPDASKVGSRLRSEWVVAVTGQLRMRKDPNSKIKTGDDRPGAGGSA